MKQMTRRERILAAVRREPVDRVPYAVWRHFPAVDRSPAGLAQATLRFHDHYGSDFIKITPGSGAAVEGWGCVEAEEVLPDGHRACASCAVRSADDWKRVRPLDPSSAPGYVEQIETIVRMGFDRRIGDAPVLPTLFSPLSLARKLSGDRLQADLREHPQRVADASRRSPRRSSASPISRSGKACRESSTRSRPPAAASTRRRTMRASVSRSTGGFSSRSGAARCSRSSTATVTASCSTVWRRSRETPGTGTTGPLLRPWARAKRGRQGL